MLVVKLSLPSDVLRLDVLLYLPLHGAIPVILDGVVRSSVQSLCYLGPLVPQGGVRSQDHPAKAREGRGEKRNEGTSRRLLVIVLWSAICCCLFAPVSPILVLAPGILLNVRIQVVVPALTALLTDASRKVRRDQGPLLRSKPANKFDNLSVLLLGPWALCGRYLLVRRRFR